MGKIRCLILVLLLLSYQLCWGMSEKDTSKTSKIILFNFQLGSVVDYSSSFFEVGGSKAVLTNLYSYIIFNRYYKYDVITDLAMEFNYIAKFNLLVGYKAIFSPFTVFGWKLSNHIVFGWSLRKNILPKEWNFVFTIGLSPNVNLTLVENRYVELPYTHKVVKYDPVMVLW